MAQLGTKPTFVSRLIFIFINCTINLDVNRVGNLIFGALIIWASDVQIVLTQIRFHSSQIPPPPQPILLSILNIKSVQLINCGRFLNLLECERHWYVYICTQLLIIFCQKQYNHLVIMTTFLWPELYKPTYFLIWKPVNPTISLIRPNFHGQTVVILTGFHCSYSFFFLKMKFPLIKIHLPDGLDTRTKF